MGHGKLCTRPPLFYPERLRSTTVPWQEAALEGLQEPQELLAVLISCSEWGSPSCFRGLLGALWQTGVGRQQPCAEEQDALRQQRALASMGELLGCILSLQETHFLPSSGLWPHPKHTYLQNTGFKEHIGVWQRVFVSAFEWNG